MIASKNLPTRTVIQLLAIMLPALALVLISYLPPFNPFTTPHLDLTGSLAQAVYWVSWTGGWGGGLSGILLVGLLTTLLLSSRAGISWQTRLIESTVFLTAGFGSLAGLHYLNEHLLKANFAVPRPNIQKLAEDKVLGTTAQEFYKVPGKKERSDYLHKVLTPEIGQELGLSERIRTHWIHETGYSFPSGHAFASMLFATFFLGLGLSCCTGPRLWICYLLAPWGSAVCISRPILRVHSPIDVLCGGLEGILAGTVVFLLVRLVLPELGRAHARPSTGPGNPI